MISEKQKSVVRPSFLEVKQLIKDSETPEEVEPGLIALTDLLLVSVSQTKFTSLLVSVNAPRQSGQDTARCSCDS